MESFSYNAATTFRIVDTKMDYVYHDQFQRIVELLTWIQRLIGEGFHEDEVVQKIFWKKVPDEFRNHEEKRMNFEEICSQTENRRS